MTIAPAWPRKTIRLLTRVTIFRHTRETTQALYLFCLYTSPLLLMNLVVCFISRCGSLESNGSFFKTCDQPVTLLRTRKKKKRNSVCRGHGIRVYAEGVLKFFKRSCRWNDIRNASMQSRLFGTTCFVYQRWFKQTDSSCQVTVLHLTAQHMRSGQTRDLVRHDK